jgi:hypothetical protein
MLTWTSGLPWRARFTRALLLFGVFGGLWIGLLGAPEAVHADESAEARVVFENKTHNFGKLIAGATASHVFRFKNEGDAELVIRRVKPSCACSAALLSDRKVAPGASGEIEVSFDSKGKMGYQTVRVHVTTNDPKEQDEGQTHTSVIQLTGQVVNLVQVMPMTAYFQRFRQGESPARQINLLPTDRKEVKVVSVETSAPWITATHSPIERGPRKGAQLTVTIGPGVPIGTLDGHVVVTIDHPDQKTVRIPVLGAVHGDLIAFPDRVFLTPRRGSEGAEATVIVKRLAGEGAIAIREVRVPGFAEFDIEELIPGVHLEVKIRLKPGLAPDSYAGTALVLVADPKQPRFEIPLTAVVPRRVAFEPGEVFVVGEGSRSISLSVPEGYAVKSLEVPESIAQRVKAKLGEGSASVEVEVTGNEPLSGEIWIVSDVPGEERVRVPVTAVAGE